MKFLARQGRKGLTKLSLLRWGILIASALIVHAPEILFDTATPNGDFNTHYHWAVQFAQAFGQGDLYPRWMWRGYLGLGEPALLYYSPLFFYASALLRPIAGSVWAAMRLVFILSTFLTGLFGYRILKPLTSEPFAIGGAVALQATPMVLMLFYYFSGFPWAVNFAALIGLAYFATRPGALSRLVDIPISIAVCVLTMTHIVSSLMTLICFSFGCLKFVHLVGPKLHIARAVYSWLVSAACGLLLSSIYLVPALTSMRLIDAAVWTKLFTPWDSFAFPTFTALLYGMRWFTFQWTVPLVVLSSVLVATWHAARRDSLSDRLGATLAVLLIVSWAAIFLSSELSYPLWLVDSPLRKVQFPHRFIFVASATGTLANLVAFWEIGVQNPSTRVKWLAAVAPLIFGVALAAALCVKLVWLDGTHMDLNQDDISVNSGLAEYRLKTEGRDWRKYISSGGLNHECFSKHMNCRVVTETSNVMDFEVVSSQAQTLRLPVFSFPAWEVQINGLIVPQWIDRETGVIVVNVPEGHDQISLIWKRLPEEWMGLWVTIVSLIGMITLAGFRSYKSRLRERRAHHHSLTNPSSSL